VRFNVLGHVRADAAALKFVIRDLSRQLRPRVYIVLERGVDPLGVDERFRHLLRV
jgi:hypothetical protein